MQVEAAERIAQIFGAMHRSGPGGIAQLFYDAALQSIGSGRDGRSGFDETRDAAGLAAAVAAGLVTEDEARELYLEKYPGARFTAGEFAPAALAVLGERAAEARSDVASEETLAEIALEERERRERSDASGLRGARAEASEGGHSIGALPDEYSREAIEFQVNRVLSSLSARIDRIEAGEIHVRPNTVDGSAIVPGTLKAEKLDPVSIGRTLQEPAAPDQAIRLELAQDSALDRWDTRTLSGKRFTGPRRIWRVNRSEIPQGWRASMGEVRYRLVVPELRLGVFSMRFVDGFDASVDLQDPAQTGSGWEFTYGIAIVGIPAVLGRKPRSVRAEFVGYAPSSQVLRAPVAAPAWLSGAPVDAEPAQTSDFGGGAISVAEAFFDPVLGAGYATPDQVTAAYAEELDGFTFQVPMGESARSVYGQVNGRVSGNLSYLTGDAHGLQASSPPGLAVPSGAVASIATRNAGGTQLAMLDFASVPGTATELYEGAPFRYADVTHLVPSEESFSLILRAWPPRIVPWVDATSGDGAQQALATGGSPDLFAAAWHSTGLVLRAPAHRELAIDLLVS